MRALHVLDLSLPTVIGYTSRARAILESQAALGIEPVAVTGLRHTAPGPEREEIGGVLHLRTPPPRVPPRLLAAPLAREAVEMAALRARLLAAHAERPAQVIHAHSPILCGLPAHAVARRTGLPSVYEIRAFWEDAAAHQGRGVEGSPRYAAVRLAETALVRASDATVAICQGIRRDLLARGVPDDQVFVVPNGVDTARFTPRPRNEELAAHLGVRDKLVVAYIGSLFRFEGVPLLLDALARVLAGRDDLRGLVAGTGEAEPDVRARHAELGLGDRVQILGKVPPARVAELYGLADVLVYPRERHRITELTTPLKPLEAMSMAKAVVVSDVGGLAELVDEGRTALTFRAGDSEDLAAALVRLADAPELRLALGDEARAEMVRARDWKRLCARYHDVYAAAAERRARGANRLAPRAHLPALGR